MISLIGFSGLFFSFLLSILIFVIYFFQNKKYSEKILYYAIYSSFVCILISFFSLMFAYINSDFTNYNVFQNSHSSKPLLYKIAGTWSNHEGSMLLWLVIMIFYNFLFSFNKTLDNNLKKLTIFFQTLLYLCFSSYVLFASNPFLVNSIEMNEGLGLNPILQDPALAIHPPMLYFGYVGFSLILSLAIAGLILDKINTKWILVTKNWTLFCWSMLTGGIALGSYWAYYELGWGGWWFWDPVENVSLMPWIAGLALVHSLMLTQKEQLLKKWIVFLSILCFSLSIFGTFLVRSGILTSVHSFASDSSRGIFILILFLVITSFSFIVFIFKSTDSNKNLNLLFLNKTSTLVINNILMIIACITILLGTIYPIIIEVISNNRISVGAPYYNSTVLPILLPGFLLMSVAPALSWQTNKLPKLKSYLFSFILMSIITLLVSYFTFFNTWGFIGIFLSLSIIGASLISFYNNYNNYGLKKFIIYNNALIAHIGVGIMIMGITCSSVFQSESNLSFSINETKEVNGYIYKLEETKIYNKKNYQELMGVFKIYKNNKIITEVKPSKRYYNVSKMITTEVGIYRHWFQDFYIILGSENDNKWSVKIYQNPLVNFIWFGVVLMIISGLIGIRKK
jgi:cytochrome c-type biogenesis protein CcmF